MRTAEAAYFDTSVLLKRYVQEPDSDRSLLLTHRYLIISAAIAPLEMRSAIRRLEASGSLSTKALQAIVKRIQTERDKWDLVAISALILESAERITVDLNVRSLDAIHLACAAACQDRLKTAIRFITADVRQRVAAQQLGLHTLPLE